MSEREDLRTLERLLAAYGTDAARWPEAVRAAGRRASATAEGRRLTAEAAALDAALDAAPRPAPADAALIAKLTALPATAPRRSWLDRLLQPSALLGEAAALAAALILGVWLGAVSVPQSVDLSAYVLAEPAEEALP